MDNEITIKNELNSISKVVGDITKNNVYTTPVGYFENLSTQILALVTKEENGYLSNVKMPFSIPQGYFENLTNTIVAKAKAASGSTEIEEELKSIAPLLNTINKSNIYKVPPNYFDDLFINTKEQGKVRSLFSGGNKVIKYAAAAIVIGIMVIGGILFFNREQNYPMVANSYTPEQIKHLSNEEIIEFLKVNASPADVIANAGSEMAGQEEDIKSSLKQMSDQEIKQYLQENAEPEELHSKEG